MYRSLSMYHIAVSRMLWTSAWLSITDRLISDTKSILKIKVSIYLEVEVQEIDIFEILTVKSTQIFYITMLYRFVKTAQIELFSDQWF